MRRAGGTRTRRTPRAPAALAALALVAAGCGGGDAPPGLTAPAPTASATPSPGPSAAEPADDPELARFYGQELDWAPCESAFQCADLRVPVDYGDPEGSSIELAVTRLRAGGPGQRIGSLVTNPGGPGASGVDYIQAASVAIGARVRARYDLVGFDPRGVGASAPVDCLSDRQLTRLLAVDVTMDSPLDISAFEAASNRFAAGCEKRTGELLGHVGTRDVARDLDVLRAVLGDEALYYLGFSYGTYVGALYAEAFPARVGRLVLDGAVDPTLSSQDLSLAQAEGFQGAWEAFAEDCLDASQCPIGRSRGEVSARLAALFLALEDEPLRTETGREVNEPVATAGVIGALYSRSQWEFLRAALLSAYNGDGTGLLALADAFLRRDGEGNYAGNINEAIYAVNCLDRPGDYSTRAITDGLDQMRAASPLFGEHIAWGNLPCGYWPVEGEAGPGPVSAPGAAPVLVIGTTRDPATPYEWATALAEQLESGVLLSFDGDGHLAYGKGDPCVDDAVEAYLLRGEAPDDGDECG